MQNTTLPELRPSDLATLWHVSPSKLRRILAGEPGERRIAQPSTCVRGLKKIVRTLLKLGRRR
jgi:hypothetical protein